MYKITRSTTIRLGKELVTIIIRQFPVVKFDRNIAPKINENIFPKETQKLIIRSPFPRYAIGTIYENIVVVKAIVIPNVKPYKNLIKSINSYVLTNAKEQHTTN
jgi:hypothetical protein